MDRTTYLPCKFLKVFFFETLVQLPKCVLFCKLVYFKPNSIPLTSNLFNKSINKRINSDFSRDLGKILYTDYFLVSGIEMFMALNFRYFFKRMFLRITIFFVKYVSVCSFPSFDYSEVQMFRIQWWKEHFGISSRFWDMVTASK